MPMFPEFNEDAFSVMVDPQTGRITLISPAPIVTFDNIDEYRGWLCYLLELIPGLNRAFDNSTAELDIDKNYAATVIDGWQKEILENLKTSPKKHGTKTSKKKRESYTSED
jgi:hypothetical protein